MHNGTTRAVLRQLQCMAMRETDASTDGQWIECYANGRDEAAFAAIVRRHGPMMLGVCRRVTGHAQGEEGAFRPAFWPSGGRSN